MSRTSRTTPRTSSRMPSRSAVTGVALVVLADDAVELERQVGERLTDPVVEVAGDAGALLVGADGAQAGEPAGVVDGQGGRLGEAGEQLAVAAGERVDSWCSTASTPTSEPAGAERDVHARDRARGDARCPPAGRRFGSATTAAVPGGTGDRLGQVLGRRATRRRGRRSAGPRARSRRSPRAGGWRRCRRRGAARSRSMVESSTSSRSSDDGQVLGHLVEAVQQVVGVGQPAHAVHGQRSALVGLAGDAAGVGGDEGDEEQLDRPLDDECGRRPGRRRPR